MLSTLAWLRATAPDPGLRSPEEALRHAAAGLELQRGESAEGHLVMALALASAGRFEAASAELDRARRLAERQGDDGLRRDLEALGEQVERQRAVRSHPRPLRVAAR